MFVNRLKNKDPLQDKAWSQPSRPKSKNQNKQTILYKLTSVLSFVNDI